MRGNAVADAIGQYAVGTKVLGRTVGPPVPSTHAAPLVRGAETFLYRLFILNIVLQIFDGVATYAGLHIGIHEGNPLLRNAFHVWGIVPALLLFKVQACGLLVFVYKIAGAQLAIFALGILAAVYCMFSLVPWLCTFVAFLVRYL